MDDPKNRPNQPFHPVVNGVEGCSNRVALTAAFADAAAKVMLHVEQDAHPARMRGTEEMATAIGYLAVRMADRALERMTH